LKYAVKTLDEVDEAQRPLYVEDKEVGFRLAVDGIEDPAELRRAKTRETEGRKVAETKLAKLEVEQATRDAAAAADKAAREEEVRKATEDAAKKAGNIDQLQKSWQDKYDKDLAAEAAKHKPIIESLNADVTREMIDRHATEIASALAIPESADETAARVAVPLIARRYFVRTSRSWTRLQKARSSRRPRARSLRGPHGTHGPGQARCESMDVQWVW
jgi:hypothetical protein